MATSAPAHVTPAVLRWARESLGYELEEAATGISVGKGKLERAEAGDDLLTLRQAERAARFYRRPLAALFLPEPPREEAQEAQFRRLPGAPEPPWPPQMQVLARRVREKQDAAAELYELLDEAPPWRAIAAELSTDSAVNRDALPRVMREVLGIGFGEQSSWRDASGYVPLRHWVDAVEALGVIVMQDGTLKVEQMRGLAAPHSDAPALVVSSKDDPRARAFTAVHELGHLVLSAVGESVGPATEAWCDEFAGEVLMPRELLRREFPRNGGDVLDRVDELALTFGVTPYAAAVGAARASALDQRTADDVIDRIRDRGGSRGGSGGNYYWTQLGRVGPGFVRLVFDALDGQALTYPAASTLLEVKVNHFDTLREYVGRRAELR